MGIYCACVHDSPGQDVPLCMCAWLLVSVYALYMCAWLPGSVYLTVHVCMTPCVSIPHCACVHDSLCQYTHCACVHDSLCQYTSLYMCAWLLVSVYLTVHVCMTSWARIPHCAWLPGSPGSHVQWGILAKRCPVMPWRPGILWSIQISLLTTLSTLWMIIAPSVSFRWHTEMTSVRSWTPM